MHAWTPPNYGGARAGLVVYVHGYRTTADAVWEQGIIEQFRRSGRDALFLVPDAPRTKHDAVRWPSLDALRSALTREKVGYPEGPVIAAGHSGAYRTLASWAGDSRLAAIVLLDASYGDPAPFRRFVTEGASPAGRKLIVAAGSTAAAAEALVRSVPGAVTRSAIPETFEQFTPEERAAKLLYLRSQYGHSAIISTGKVLPLLLRLTSLPDIVAAR